MKPRRPHIVLVAGRGEVLRNFLYSETLARLGREAEVTVLSVVTNEKLVRGFSSEVDRIIPLEQSTQPKLTAYLRALVESAHERWLWSAVARNAWELRDRRAKLAGRSLNRALLKSGARLLSHRPILRALTRLEQELTPRLGGKHGFDDLFARLQPDLVFNGSHVHGSAAELPLRVAHQMGIRTAGFIFSWDNLTSRSRIFVPYDDYLVWHAGMRRQLLEIYPEVGGDHVFVTGTPQLDYHFNPDFMLSREELCGRLGIDARRPFVLYTTGVDRHFPHEHLHVEQVARLLGEIGLEARPQLVVRTYVKGTSHEMRQLAERQLPDVVFPPVLWDSEWQTPRYDDLAIYTSLLAHTALGINAASTVSLELMIFDKPIINLRFDPPGTDLPWCLGYERHILFDHFRPVAESGATMVARSPEDMKQMLRRGLVEPAADSAARRRFLRSMFGDELDGNSGCRVAERLLALARKNDI